MDTSLIETHTRNRMIDLVKNVIQSNRLVILALGDPVFHFPFLKRDSENFKAVKRSAQALVGMLITNSKIPEEVRDAVLDYTTALNDPESPESLEVLRIYMKGLAEEFKDFEIE